MTTTLARAERATPVTAAWRSVRLPAVVVVLVLLVAGLGLVDLSQGTATLDPAQLWAALTGAGDRADAAVILASRIPRMAAGLTVGVALGIAGAALQAITRNVLASPDTLAVNAGAYFALAVASVAGLQLPLLASSGIAFVGGLAAAVIVLALSGLGSGTVRLVLAGSALALGIGSVTSALILLFPQDTQGLYYWGQGSISQSGPDGVPQMLPVVAVAIAGLLVIGRRMDALALGDDSARSLGVGVRGTRIITIVCSVLLSAAAVTLAGPIGFIGLCAPALVRPFVRVVPGLSRSRAFLPVAGLVGAAIVLAADVLLRATVGAELAVGVPTGVVTALVGAVFLVTLAVRSRDSGAAAAPDRLALATRRRFVIAVSVIVTALLAAAVAGILLGDTKLLLGDVTNWLQGHANSLVSYVMQTRVPRVAAALLAGAALALGGTLVQAVTRNPLAEPGILGVSGGAGLAAVIAVTAIPTIGSLGISIATLIGAAVVAVLVFGLTARGGFRQNRLVLVGVGVSAATVALISLVVVLTDPFNAAKALTWLSGSTYGRTFADLGPLAVVLVVVTTIVATQRRELDLVALDEDTPRLLGIRLGRTRLLFLAAGVVLTAAAIACVGAIGFVGLVAPHAARAIVGRRHGRVLPVAMLLGGVLVCIADAVGRTVIAPAQLGAGLLTAVLGTPYFIWLLWRSRR